jgi:hypothetical protein
MWKVVSVIFVEAWSRRQNRFIAVGGTAVLLVFVTMALEPVPWVPELLKKALALLCGVSIVATILLMFYYVAKFAVLGVVFLFKKTCGLQKQEERAALSERNPAK